MRIIKKMRKQKAVWWKKLSADEYGSATWDDPIEIDCRWDDHIGRVMDGKGELMMSKATVFVDREMSLGDKLRKGDMDSDEPLTPADVTTAYEIVGFEQIPTLKADKILYIAHL